MYNLIIIELGFVHLSASISHYKDLQKDLTD
jgi:hypothetical protein